MPDDDLPTPADRLPAEEGVDVLEQRLRSGETSAPFSTRSPESATRTSAPLTASDGHSDLWSGQIVDNKTRWSYWVGPRLLADPTDAARSRPRRSGRSREPIVDDKKYDYLFGRVASNRHNSDRSRQNQRQLASIGIHDGPTGRRTLREHFSAVILDDSNILRTFSNAHGTFEIRESLLAGPGGIIKLETTWHVTDGGYRLTTIFPLGGQ